MEGEIEEEIIIIDDNICLGQPVIKGTRITVRLILRFLADGRPVDQVLEAYPFLKLTDIQACFRYAENIIDKEWKNRTGYSDLEL